MSPMPRLHPALALAAFAWPAMCLAGGCDCESVCPAFGPHGCVAIASVAAFALFVTLGFSRELQLLAALQPGIRFDTTKEKS